MGGRSNRRRILPVGFAISLCWLAVLPYATEAGWSPTGLMGSARYFHAATLLPNGIVLITGGDSNGPALSSAELYDPATGTFTFTGPMSAERASHTATLLPTGKVLIAGSGSWTNPRSAELYDPALGTFVPTGSMGSVRHSHTATLLSNGKILVTGGRGQGVGNDGMVFAEMYDPGTGIWSNTGSMSFGRFDHTATLLPNGKVLIAGGAHYDEILRTFVYWNVAELFDPATGTFAPTGALNYVREGHTATLLPNGKVLMVGGYSSVLPQPELYDPATSIFTPTGSMGSPFPQLNIVTLLPNGNVLVAGEGVSEMYNPSSGTFSTRESMMASRWRHTGTLLPNGKILVTGGGVGANTALGSAELYDFVLNPSYTISASAGPGGTITPSGAVSVNSGASQAFTINANAGYVIADILVDGLSSWPFPNQNTSANYNINNVLADHTINATFNAFVADTTPDPFAFTPATGVPLNTAVTSNTITISGINSPAAISITGGLYSINNGSFVSAPGTITNGSTVRVAQTSQGGYGATTYTTMTIGGVSGTFSVTTVTNGGPDPGPTPVGYSPEWLVITLASLTLAGGYLLRRRGRI